TPSAPKPSPQITRRASTRASSRSLPRGAIATESTCATSCNSRASSAAASPPIPTISDSPNPAHLAAKSAMSSPSHSVAVIIVRWIAAATNARGGSRPASTRSRLPAGSGRRHAGWASGGLHEWHYLARMPLPRPRTQSQRMRKSAPQQRRKKELAYLIFQASGARAAGCSGMTMWRPNEPVEEDVSDLPGIDPHSKRRRSRRHAWRDGLADQTVVQGLEDVRSYRAFERTLVGSVDPRSVIELALVHRLANLLWRLRRASAIETGLFEIQGEFLLAQRQSSAREQPGAVQTARANGHGKRPRSTRRPEPPTT